jgi:hypothetical protein
VNRVLRGGSWSNDLRYLRSAHRNAYAPDYKNTNAGFRLAISLDSGWAKKMASKANDAAKRAESMKEEAAKGVESVNEKLEPVKDLKKGIESGMPSSLPGGWPVRVP